MATVGDDCYFFCTSTCAKGAACPFRHVESAKTNKIICQHWQTSQCLRPMCKFRHSDFHIQVNYSEIPCYWESQPVGCNKPTCVYKHNKPRPDFSKTAAAQAKPNSPDQKAGTDKTDEGKDVVDQFVMPTVKPVIIDPESEASNSSPVKKPPPKETTEDASEQGKEMKKDTESSNLKKDDEGTGGKGEGKKALKVVGKKRKAGVLTQKNGKLGTSAKGVKKVKNIVDGSPATKVPVKRKMVKDATSESKTVVPAKMKVKDRLGTKPAIGISGQKKKEEQSDLEESSSSSDSDDSIENVKVLSMEEIFRQKALESMMKKRAAEGKPMLPEYNSSKKKCATIKPQPHRPAIVDERPKRPVIADNRPRKKPVVKKKPPTPPPPPQESESEDDEEEEEDGVDNEEEVKDNSEEEEEEKSSESESSSEDSSESEDGEVRRVVINLDAEKAAREKAKASLTKKHQVSRNTAGKTLKRRKVIHEGPPLSLSRNATSSSSSQRLTVKDRLGAHTSAVISREVKKKVSSSSEEESEESDEIEKDERFSDVKVKSLGELQQEKFNRLGNSPIKDRLGPAKTRDVEDEEDVKTGRQILLTEDVPSPKKSKRRPWSSSSRQNKTGSTVHQEMVVVEEDQRTVSATSPVEKEPINKPQIDEPESPYESLRRRALLKKTQQFQENVTSDIKEEESEEAEEEVVGKRKKHKHKHKHKKHKKSKSERQIYVPPPAKKSVITEVLERVKKVPSSLSRQEDIPEYEEDSITFNKSIPPTTTVQARPKPRAASMWAAGLSVSSKGLGGRPLLRMETEKQDVDSISVNVPSRNSSFTTSKNSASALSSTSVRDSGGSSVPVVKTFSQIMAEKRQKRQQIQESGVDDDHSLSSSPSRIPSRTESSRPRAPITPIRFDLDAESKANQPQRTKSATTSVLNRVGLSQSPPPAIAAKSQKLPINLNSTSSSPGSSKSTSSSIPLSDIRPTYKTARAKKLFNKKPASKSQLESFQSDSPTHISSSSSPSVSVDTTTSSSTNHHHQHHHHHHHKSIEKRSDDPVPAGDGSVALKSPTTDGKKHRKSSESNSKQATSVDDEFNFFDGGDEIEDIGDIIGKDVEPIDDLLQDIDDLLA